jgi:hypothetical protein
MVAATGSGTPVSRPGLADKNTFIDVGYPLSRNFLLEHLTSGAYHQIMGTWLPKFSSPLIPHQIGMLSGSSGFPVWQIVRNLQIGSQNILERMVNYLGQDFNIQSGFMSTTNLAGELAHTLGQSLDIQIRGYEDNMYSVANDILKLSKGVSSIELVYGGASSWIHLEYDENTLLNTIKAFPTFKTRDLVEGVIENGLTSIRGFV